MDSALEQSGEKLGQGWERIGMEKSVERPGWIQDRSGSC